MSCARRRALQQQHEIAEANLDACRQRLGTKGGICSKAEFLVLTDQLDRAWEVLHHASAALENHIRKHQCLEKQDEAVAASDVT
jgi:hypothetical protein